MSKKGYYEQSCEDFALYSSPWQEHCEDSGSDYQSELWAGEAASMNRAAEIEELIDNINSDEFVGPREESW